MTKINLTKLETENQNPKTKEIDTFSTAEILTVINEEDLTVALAVRKILPQITVLVEEIVDRLKEDGRLIYIGAGSSGRISFADAAECPPTYGVSYDKVQGIIAGGTAALYQAQEGAEDDDKQGIQDVKNISLCAKDVLIGVAASGRTPYVIGALNYANEIGCYTAAVTCVSDSEMAKVANIAIEAVTGAEVITGSTRMKAGTAQKMVLNMISTAVMVRLGKVYDNYMVDVSPTNIKLENRAKGIIKNISGCDEATAEEFYQKADKSVKLAVLMILSQLDKSECEKLLSDQEGHLKQALKAVGK